MSQTAWIAIVTFESMIILAFIYRNFKNTGISKYLENLVALGENLANIGKSLKTSSEDLKNDSNDASVEVKNLAENFHLLTKNHALVSEDIEQANKKMQAIQKESSEVIEQINHLKNSVEATNSTIENVRIISSELGKIRESIDKISDVAFETKILATNTAIEASRSEREARGFRVIAEEVQNLSNRVLKISKQIDLNLNDGERKIIDLTGKIKSDVDQHSNLLKDVMKKMSNFIDEIPATYSKLNRISATNKEENSLLENMNQRTESVKKTIENNQSKSLNIFDTGVKLQSIMEDLNRSISDIIGFINKSAITHLSPEEVKPNIKNYFAVIDVRRKEEFNDSLGHIHSARLITIDESFQKRFKRNFPSTNKKYLIVCRSGGRSARAAQALQKIGYKKVVNMEGGMLRWNELKYPTE